MTNEVVKKSLSLRSDLYDFACGQSERLHGGNFSSYLAYLISCHKQNTIPYKNNDNEGVFLTKDRMEKLLMCEKFMEKMIDLLFKNTDIIDEKHLIIEQRVIKEMIGFFTFEELDEEYNVMIKLQD